MISFQKEMEKEMKILMGKNLDIFKFFFWWKLSRWKKKPGRSKDFVPLKKEMVSFQKEMEKEMKILMGKNLDIFKFFLWWKLHRWKTNLFW